MFERPTLDELAIDVVREIEIYSAFDDGTRRFIAHALSHLPPWPHAIGDLHEPLKVLLADKDNDPDFIREDMERRGGIAMIPTKRNRLIQLPVDAAIYALRNMVERCFSKLKNARRLATRISVLERFSVRAPARFRSRGICAAVKRLLQFFTEPCDQRIT